MVETATHIDTPRPTPLACDKCGKTGVQLKECSACQNVRYCSLDCQKAAWKHHKPHCKKRQPAKTAPVSQPSTNGSDKKKLLTEEETTALIRVIRS